MSKTSQNDRYRSAAQNRRARHDYEILEEYEAGIVLGGSEVKSLRAGKASIQDSYADVRGGALWLVNSHIPVYLQAGRFNHDPYRPRKLLMHKKEIRKLIGKTQTKGLTLIPLSVYFNARGLAKVKLALGRGKTKHDKRESEKKRDWQREKSRILKGD